MYVTFVVRFSRFNGGGWPPPVTRRWNVAPPPFPNSPWKRRISDETKRAFRSPSFAVSYFHFAIRPFSFFPSRDCTRGGGGKWRSLKRGETLFPPPTYRERAFIVGRWTGKWNDTLRESPLPPPFLSLFLHNNNFSYVNESENFSPCLGSSKDGNDFTICYSNYFNFLEESWNEVVITFFIL